MKDIKEIWNNKRLRFLCFLRSKDEQRVYLGGDTIEPVSNKVLHWKFTRDIGWEHLSVSTSTKCPTWEQMCFMKDQFWNDNEVCFQLHPKKEDYVNNHNYCLHIWKQIDGDIPTPPRIMVGVKNEEDMKQIKEIIKNGVGVLKIEDCIQDEMFVNRR